VYVHCTEAILLDVAMGEITPKRLPFRGHGSQFPRPKIGPLVYVLVKIFPTIPLLGQSNLMRLSLQTRVRAKKFIFSLNFFYFSNFLNMYIMYSVDIKRSHENYIKKTFPST